MQDSLKILMLEDSSTDAELIQRMLRKEWAQCAFTVASSKQAFIKQLKDFAPDLVLADNALPGFSAAEALELLQSAARPVPFILVTGTVSEEFAATIIKKGAEDYILKDRLTRLPAAIEAALKHQQAAVEKQNAADKLRLSEEKYRMLVEHAFDGNIIYNLDGRILDCNYSTCQYLGYSLEELQKLSVTDLFFKEDLQQRPIYFESLKAGHSTIDYRRLRRKDGTHVDMEIVTKMMPDGKLMAVGRDITERKKAAEQQSLFASIVNSSEDAIISKTTDGIITSWNRGATNTFGYDPREVIGQHISIIIPPDLVEEENSIADRVKTGAVVQHYETMRLHKNGSEVYVSIAMSPVRSSRGAITGCAIIARDVTDNRKKEQAIRESNERFEMVTRATNDIIWDWNTETDILWWNPNFYHHFGFKPAPVPENVSSRYLHIHSEDRERVLSTISNCFREKEAFWKDEYRFITASGETAFVLDCAYILYKEDGSPYRMVGAMLDITNRKKAEELVRNSMEEKQALAAKTSSILNTLPANIALLDAHGVIVDINDAWRRFARQNGFPGDNFGVGENYIHVCENSKGIFSKGAKDVGKGLRDVLENYVREFVYEYPCHSPHEKRWYRMIATPLKDRKYRGAVVMHLDISEIKRLEEERLKSKMTEQKKITRAMLLGQEQERSQIGQELHDNISQLLAAVRMKLNLYLAKSAVKSPVIADCVANLEEAVAETRNLSHRMLMPRFKESSFREALQSLAHNYVTPTRKVQIEAASLMEATISPAILETLYRIAQEQLHNIDKHAHASKINIVIGSTDQHAQMSISDNGNGFDLKEKRQGVGLTNIMNRAESFNGHVKILSEPGHGCMLLVDIPLAE